MYPKSTPTSCRSRRSPPASCTTARCSCVTLVAEDASPAASSTTSTARSTPPRRGSRRTRPTRPRPGSRSSTPAPPFTRGAQPTVRRRRRRRARGPTRRSRCVGTSTCSMTPASGPCSTEYLGERPALSAKKTHATARATGLGSRLAPGRRLPRSRRPHRQRLAGALALRCRRARPRHRPRRSTSSRPAPKARSSTGRSDGPSSSEQPGRAASCGPVFDAGDTLLFDERNLHATACSPVMTADRYAVEAWFFAAVAVPGQPGPAGLLRCQRPSR